MAWTIHCCDWTVHRCGCKSLILHEVRTKKAASAIGRMQSEVLVLSCRPVHALACLLVEHLPGDAAGLSQVEARAMLQERQHRVRQADVRVIPDQLGQACKEARRRAAAATLATNRSADLASSTIGTGARQLGSRFAPVTYVRRGRGVSRPGGDLGARPCPPQRAASGRFPAHWVRPGWAAA